MNYHRKFYILFFTFKIYKMSKDDLITAIRDSLVSGNIKEAYDAIDELVFEKQKELRSIIIDIQQDAERKVRGISLVDLNKK